MSICTQSGRDSRVSSRRDPGNPVVFWFFFKSWPTICDGRDSWPKSCVWSCTQFGREFCNSSRRDPNNPVVFWLFFKSWPTAQLLSSRHDFESSLRCSCSSWRHNLKYFLCRSKRQWFNINNCAKLHSRCVLQLFLVLLLPLPPHCDCDFENISSMCAGITGIKLGRNLLGILDFLSIFGRKFSDFFTNPVGAHPNTWCSPSLPCVAHDCSSSLSPLCHIGSDGHKMLRESRGDRR